MKQYKSWNPDQEYLLPPSPREWLPAGHLAYFIIDVVSELDLGAIEGSVQAKDPRGTMPYAPAMMVALLLYGYCVGVFSSRKIERATYENVAFRVLAGDHHPHFTRINEFRKQHLVVLKGFFLQVLKLCQKAGLVKLGLVALDGTKIQGNASKHKAMSYDHMLKSELQLQGEIDELLSRANEVDDKEDVRFGSGQREEDLPAELQRRQDRLAKIREAKQQLESEAMAARARELREQAERARQRAETHVNPVERKRAATMAANRAAQARELDPDASDDDTTPPTTASGLPMHEPQTTKQGVPDDKAQMNFTDPDSRIMESGGAYLQGYNCQAVVDAGHQIIVASAVSNKAPDNGNLVPMIKMTIENCGAAPTKGLADAGFWNVDAPAACDALGTETLISTARARHGTQDAATASGSVDATPETTTTPQMQSAREQMRAKLETEEGRRAYARRKVIVEPVFGQVKEARGFRRFLLRGLEKVEAEWALVCTGHNLLKLFRFFSICEQPA
jgi:transposase